MIRILATLAAMTLFGAGAYATKPLPPEKATIGKPAPYFGANDVLHGTVVELDKLKGKPVVLEWNNFGCPFVRKHYESGNMQKLQREAIAGGAEWITINSSAEGKQGFLKDAKAVKTALAEHDAAPSHYVLDPKGDIGKLYGATATPHMFVIDTDGILVYAGAIDDKPTPDQADIADAKNYVRNALAALKAGEKVDPAQTKAYGCGVKYAY